MGSIKTIAIARHIYNILVVDQTSRTYIGMTHIGSYRYLPFSNNINTQSVSVV